MHSLLRDNIESYLSGTLTRGEQEAVEAHLAACPECRRDSEIMRDGALALRSLRPPRDLELEPAPGFYARVIDGIDHEREVPFWAMLLDPGFGRRVVFACLMLLAMLGAYVASADQTDFSLKHRPEAMIAGRPSPLPHYGSNLDRNRGAVLASLVSEGD